MVYINEELQVTVGNPITIKPSIQSCPTPISAMWQKRSGNTTEEFEMLDINDSKYFGSEVGLEDPRLIIPETTHEDGIYYRLIVSNGLGQSTSNTAFLKLIGGKCILLVEMVRQVFFLSFTYHVSFCVIQITIGERL